MIDLKKIATKITYQFSTDLRSLAILRIGTALVVLIDLINRSFNLTTHYTDKGVFPISAFIHYQSTKPWNLSLHAISGEITTQIVLFLLSGLFAFLLLIGYKTKIATIISWIMLTSLQYRNPLLIFGSDQLLQLLLFWGMFLPWGERFSIDGKNMTHNSNEIATAWSTGYFIQILILYSFTAYSKAISEYWIDGTALNHILTTGHVAKKSADILLSFPQILPLVSYGVTIFEGIVLILLLIPSRKQILRLITIFLLVCMNLSFSLFLSVELFTLVSIVSLLGLLPSSFWDIFLSNMFKQHSVKKNKTHSPRLNLEISYKGIICVCVLIFLIFSWKFNYRYSRTTFPDSVYFISRFLGFHQEWSMFQKVDQYTFWPIVTVETSNHKVINLSHENIMIGNPNTDIISMYQNDRSRKYYISLFKRKLTKSYYKDYLLYECTKWNNNYSKTKQAKVIRLIRGARKTGLNKNEPIHYKVLMEIPCGSN